MLFLSLKTLNNKDIDGDWYFKNIQYIRILMFMEEITLKQEHQNCYSIFEEQFKNKDH